MDYTSCKDDPKAYPQCILVLCRVDRVKCTPVCTPEGGNIQSFCTLSPVLLLIKYRSASHLAR